MHFDWSTPLTGLQLRLVHNIYLPVHNYNKVHTVASVQVFFANHQTHSHFRISDLEMSKKSCCIIKLSNKQYIIHFQLALFSHSFAHKPIGKCLYLLCLSFVSLHLNTRILD